MMVEYPGHRSRLIGLVTLCLAAMGCGDSGDLPGNSRGNNNGSSSSNAGSGSGGSGEMIGDVIALDLPPEGEMTVDNRGTGDDCDATHPCAAESEVCVLDDGNACGGTGDGQGGVCQRVQSATPCTTDDQCQGDTRCCVGDCRVDGVAEGQCVAVCGVDLSCRSDIAIGVFAPSLQCEWTTPPAGDPHPEHKRVFASPVVAQLPYDSGAAAEIVIVASAATTGASATDPTALGGVIRVLNGQTCAHVAVVDATLVRDTATPAIADIDGDGLPEIVTRTAPAYPNSASSVVAFRWDAAVGAFTTAWVASGSTASANGDDWDGVSIHNLDDDPCAEIIGRGGEVVNCMGQVLAAGDPNIAVVSDPAVGDVDGDGIVELVANKVYEWTGAGWAEDHPGPNLPAVGAYVFYAFADFGTVDANGVLTRQLDGIAEVVVSGTKTGGATPNADDVALFSLSGQLIMRVGGTFDRGGPPTIGDFDGDGFPEFASADGRRYRVFDPDCYPAGGGACEEPGILWSRPSDDASSAQTGSSIFDFEADGKAEVVYADECFARIYDGTSGDVLFSSYRASCTWWESPVIADPDNDSRTEIIVNSNPNCFACQEHQTPEGTVSAAEWYLPFVDPLHAGIRCDTAADCPSASCVAGYCRCTTDAECGGQIVLEQNDLMGQAEVRSLKCAVPPADGPALATDGNTCRAQNPNPDTADKLARVFNGVRVLRDVLDRWAPSRPLWNQHAYHVTHINDDLSLPPASQWQPNFLDPTKNNYRQNLQGENADYLPDIAGLLNKDLLCAGNGTTLTLNAEVCNRGLRAVGAGMPATFYLGPKETNDILCVSYTDQPMPEGSCVPVSCAVGADKVIPDASTITMEVNNDGAGAATTRECKTDNNVDSIMVEKCDIIR